MYIQFYIGYPSGKHYIPLHLHGLRGSKKFKILSQRFLEGVTRPKISLGGWVSDQNEKAEKTAR